MTNDLRERVMELSLPEWLRLREILTEPLSRALVLFKHGLVSELELVAVAEACQAQLSGLPTPRICPEAMVETMRAVDAKHAADLVAAVGSR